MPSSTEFPPDLQPGTLLDARYRLIDHLGSGGMSTVWRARDERLGRIVAIKVLAPALIADAVSRQRLRTEAQSLARLSHSHIADVYDYATAETTSGTVPFLVMELVHGRSLSDVLAQDGTMPWQQAVAVTAQIAAALAAAHQRGIVHRDISAGNVLLTATGVKLIDFGICAGEGDPEIDDSGQLVGTPAYLAPERIVGRPVQPTADVYAVGVLLYRMLSGHLPFAASSPKDLIRAHHSGTPEPLPSIEGMPSSVEELCTRCIAKDPGERPTAAAIAQRATDLSGGGAVPLFDLAHEADGTTTMPTHLLPWSDITTPARHTKKESTGRRMKSMAAAAVLVVAAAAWAAQNWLGDDQGTATPTASPSAPPTCAVTYQSLRDNGRTFTAAITATNLGTAPIKDARLSFDLGGDQRVSRTSPPVWQQSDHSVSTVGGLLDLGVRHGARLPLSGTYATSNPFPMQFWLDDKPCAVTIIGPAGKPVVTPSGLILPSGPALVVTDISASPTAGTAKPPPQPSPKPPAPGSSPSPAEPSPPPATSSPVPIISQSSGPQTQVEPSPSRAA
jgi:eukaryotic-like serine/threonine-protein kinase